MWIADRNGLISAPGQTILYDNFNTNRPIENVVASQFPRNTNDISFTTSIDHGQYVNTIIFYNFFWQKISEFSWISKGDQQTELVEMHLNYYFPREAQFIFSECKFTTEIFSGFNDSNSISPYENDIFLLKAKKILAHE